MIAEYANSYKKKERSFDEGSRGNKAMREELGLFLYSLQLPPPDYKKRRVFCFNLTKFRSCKNNVFKE